MNKLTKPTIETLQQIILIIDNPALSTKIYADSGIGRHVRHVIDHFMALKNSLKTNLVDYNCRHRDSEIEIDKQQAKQSLVAMIDWLDSNQLEDRMIKVYSEISCQQTLSCEFCSTVDRELLYLINHTIHHTAYIKLVMQTYDIKLDKSVGLAPGTATYFRQQEQVSSCAH